MADRYEYIVTLKKGTVLEDFNAEMVSEHGDAIIPTRSVEVANERVGSQRFINYYLTKREAKLLRLEDRVLNVELTIKDNPDIVITKSAVQESNFDKPSGVFWEDNVNWGLIRSSSTTNVYGAGNTPTKTAYEYPVDGRGVDVVIMDSGIDLDHPEFGNRVQSINWAQEAGLSGTIQHPSTHDTDPDGHGTHVAGIAAGSTYGWAKNAHIYSLHVDLGSDTTGYSIEDAFDVLLNWHNSKTSGRPTIVNMSWGVSVRIANANILGGVYQGQEWNAGDLTRGQIWQNFGIVAWNDNNVILPASYTSIDVAVEELIDAGIHVITAAGNSIVKVDFEFGIEYDNTVTLETATGIVGTFFTNRPGSPYHINAINVGALDHVTVAGEDKVWYLSDRGPAVDIFAAGSDIISAYSSFTPLTQRASSSYYKNENFKQASLSGTSMAAPQVAGVAALYAQVNPNINPLDLKDAIKRDSLKTQIFDTNSATDYTNYNQSLLGSPNNILLSKYRSKTPGTYENVRYANFKNAR